MVTMGVTYLVTYTVSRPGTEQNFHGIILIRFRTTVYDSVDYEINIK